jgi:hypothetical protein
LRKLLVWTTTASVLLGCALGAATPVQAETPAASAGTTTTDINAKIANLPVDDATKAKIKKVLNALPADWSQRVAAVSDRFGIDSDWQEMVKAVAAGDCVNPTAIGDWMGEQLRDVDTSVLDMIGELGGFALPFIDAILIQTDATPQSFGQSGEYTTTVTNTRRDLDKFWDIKSDDIQTIAMHGDILTDVDRMAAAAKLAFRLTEAQARELGEAVNALVRSEPALENGANPVFTFNAIAVSGEGVDDKLVMGDGLLEGMTGIGLGDVGPKAILAHEYGHHIQYENDLIGDGDPTPEASRRVELMADAFSSYFLTHKRGQALNTKRVIDAERAYAEVGDCQTASPGHHGTPDQRAASGTWAAEVVASAEDQGHILPSRNFATLFDANLDDIIAG